MCHVLNVDLSHVECQNGWLLGYKAINVDENGVYKSPFLAAPYNVVELPSGLLVYDVQTEPHSAMIMFGRPVLRRFEINVPAGLHAYLGRCAQYRHYPKQYRWVVAARREWICFCTQRDFSARMLICAKDNDKLRRSIEEYEDRMEEIWSFTCDFVRKKPTDPYCVVGEGDSASIASYKLLCVVEKKGLSRGELDCFRQALWKCVQRDAEAQTCWRQYYAVARSRLWAPQKRERNNSDEG